VKSSRGKKSLNRTSTLRRGSAYQLARAQLAHQKLARPHRQARARGYYPALSMAEPRIQNAPSARQIAAARPDQASMKLASKSKRSLTKHRIA
jgi:hypothetical protein